MSRLYLRIFLSFWLVIILVISSVMVINSQLDRALRDETQLRERLERLEEGLVQPAESALNEAGHTGLASWLDDAREGMRRMQLQVFDAEGREISGQDPAPRTRRTLGHWVEHGSRPEGARRGLFTRELKAGEEATYLLVLSRPPSPWFVRLLGPLGPWGLLVIAVLISGLICFWLARNISRPVQGLRAAGQALGEGRLDSRVSPEIAARGDELGHLAADFNRMAARLEQLVSGQRQLLRDVSHELRSPLARLRVSLALASSASDPGTRSHNLSRIEAETERLNHLIGEILDYARIAEAVDPPKQSVDLMELLDDIATSARLEARPRGLRVTLQGPESCRLKADGELLYRALENVVRNALAHSPEGGLVEIRLTPPDTGGDLASLDITDSGPGVPDDQLESIFEPFVRLSEQRGSAGSGGGVGLSIAREAVRRHGGLIRAENRRGGGLRVRILLPVDAS